MPTATPTTGARLAESPRAGLKSHSSCVIALWVAAAWALLVCIHLLAPGLKGSHHALHHLQHLGASQDPAAGPDHSQRSSCEVAADGSPHKAVDIQDVVAARVAGCNRGHAYICHSMLSLPMCAGVGKPNLIKEYIGDLAIQWGSESKVSLEGQPARVWGGAWLELPGGV